MKKFLLKVIAFGFVAGFVILGFLVYYHLTQQATLDPYYRRFTTGRYPSLILGSSRAAQGLRPDIFDREMAKFYDTPFFNYSFTMGTSNIGPTYLNKLKKHLKNSENSLFILCVNPWILSRSAMDVNDEEFKEEDTFFAHQKTQNMSPNLEYLLFHDNKNQSFFTKIFHPDSTFYYLHKNGWLQVNYNNKTQEAEENKKWQIERLSDDLKNIRLSEKRFKSLDDILKYLKSKGTVFLVRLPTGVEIKEAELKAFPDFDFRVKSIAQKNKITYLNLLSESGAYETVDGNHIYKDDTEKLSERICALIKMNEK